MAEAKTKAEVEEVKMEDGRTVGFAGNRKVLKEVLLDASKIVVDGDSVILQAGAVGLRMDFRNGSTRTYPMAPSMVAQFAGHGQAQKYGDELASTKDNPLSEEDMVLATEALHEQLFGKGEWTATREGGGGSGFSGAHAVIQAIAEVRNVTVEKVKAFLQAKLDADKAAGGKLSRKALYDAFRKPGTPVGDRVLELEAKKKAGKPAIDADAALEELGS